MMVGWTPDQVRKATHKVPVPPIKDTAVRKQAALRSVLPDGPMADVYHLICSLAFTFDDLLFAGNANALKHSIKFAGAEVNKDLEGKRPMHIAICYNYLEVVKVLLTAPELDIFADARDILGMPVISAFETTIVTNKPKIMRVIAEAKPSVLQATNPSPLNLAIDWQKQANIKLLIELGCHGPEYTPNRWHRVPVEVEKNQTMLGLAGRHESCPALLHAMGRRFFTTAHKLLNLLPPRTLDELSDALVLARHYRFDRLAMVLFTAGADDDAARTDNFKAALEARLGAYEYVKATLKRSRAIDEEREWKRQCVREEQHAAEKTKLAEELEQAKTMSDARLKQANWYKRWFKVQGWWFLGEVALNLFFSSS